MEKLFDNFRVQVADLPHEQVREHVRQIVISGQLAPGEMLPSTQRLAQLCGTHVATVHKALVGLVREGLLVRINGKGTFVRKREERLTCVGIYFCEDVWARHSSEYLMAIHAAVKEELNRQGVRTQVWVDPRPLSEQATPWPELCKAAAHREIQGLIVPALHWHHLAWLTKLPIPSAYLGFPDIPSRVAIDFRQLAEMSLRRLAEQGCRSVGLIAPFTSAPNLTPDGPIVPYKEFFDRFTDLASDLGLAMRNEWMRVASNVVDLGRIQLQEEYGYTELLRLWSLPKKPEGLMVFPDTAARGVILGLREKQVCVPQDLKLVFHKNESIPLLCPMPATLAVLSERAFAQALIEQVQKQFRGESCLPIKIGFTLSPTDNTIKESIK